MEAFDSLRLILSCTAQFNQSDKARFQSSILMMSSIESEPLTKVLATFDLVNRIVWFC